MKISLSWLKEFVALPADLRELKSALTTVGLNVEGTARAGDDTVLELEVTSNRPDCLSHYGVAREMATYFRQPLKRLEIAVKESGGAAAQAVAIEIADPDLCARYCGRVIENVQVKPSPDWLQRRLEAVGQRPINNVADITNYVLLELGHPLHAFDLARLRQRKIIVRRAKTGEHLRTLDGVDRALAADHLVIADAERAVALAGVMGGEDSEISTSTRAVLLESAWFDPVSIRRTSKAHGMHTEASHRFERGADIEMAPVALDRTAALIAEVAGGQVLHGVMDVYPRPLERKALVLRRSEIVRILGTEVACEEVERILRSLGFQTERREGGGWSVTAPSFRPDITREVDLIEEVARHFGYDRLPSRVRPAPPRVERDTRREKELTISARLVGLGYREIIPSSMIDPEENARFTDAPPVVLANPLSQEASAMRSTAVPSMLRAVRWNLDRGQSDLRLFEVGKTYARRSGGLPDERRALTLGLTGTRLPVPYYDPDHPKAKPVGFFDLKGDLETLLASFELPGLSFEEGKQHYYEVGAAGRFVTDGQALVEFGRIRAEFTELYKLHQDVWMAEVDLERLLKFSLPVYTFHPFSRFPAVERDFSLLVPEGKEFRELEQAVLGLKLESLQRLQPMEEFRGGKIEKGKYSLLLRVTFQSQDHTLTSEEVSSACGTLLEALQQFGVRLRAQ
ncbi:MAG: phenylalanine--tRNA ligase subunit beta [Terriglobia bacterium]